jgi:putative transcriptional regulator
MNDKLEDSIIKGLNEAVEYATGVKNNSKKHVVAIPKDIDVLKIRENLHMTREKFSKVFGFPMRTLEKWEQGLRRPTGATRAYLCVIQKDPDAVKKALEDVNNLDFDSDDHVLV